MCIYNKLDKHEKNPELNLNLMVTCADKPHRDLWMSAIRRNRVDKSAGEEIIALVEREHTFYFFAGIVCFRFQKVTLNVP